MEEKRILLISDTHSYLDSRLLPHVRTVDEVWHAGDIGDISVIDQLKSISNCIRAVYGNIDDNIVRSEFKKDLHFDAGGFRVWMTHIGGYPPRYTANLKRELDQIKPDIFICGHSHILRVIYDPAINCLHLNPGAVGKHGFHPIQTALKFTIGGKEVKKMEILEFKRT